MLEKTDGNLIASIMDGKETKERGIDWLINTKSERRGKGRMNIIKMKVQKSIAAWEQSQKVNNPICIAYGQNCPSLPNFYILDSEIFTEDNIAPIFDEAIKKWGNNKPVNVIIWTNEPQEKNQWLINLCLNNKDIIDFWFYCLPEMEA